MSEAPKYSRGLSEVALGVEDVAASAKFYAEVVGLVTETLEETFATLWAGTPGRHQRVILLSNALAPVAERHDETVQHTPPSGPSDIASISPVDFGRTHFAFHVERDDLTGAVAHVQDCGVEIYGPVEFELMEASAYYFLDPDGHLVEFWSPSPEHANLDDRQGVEKL